MDVTAGLCLDTRWMVLRIGRRVALVTIVRDESPANHPGPLHCYHPFAEHGRQETALSSSYVTGTEDVAARTVNGMLQALQSHSIRDTGT